MDEWPRILDGYLQDVIETHRQQQQYRKPDSQRLIEHDVD
jgi:hypothetical protein